MEKKVKHSVMLDVMFDLCFDTLCSVQFEGTPTKIRKVEAENGLDLEIMCD